MVPNLETSSNLTVTGCGQNEMVIQTIEQLYFASL